MRRTLFLYLIMTAVFTVACEKHTPEVTPETKGSYIFFNPTMSEQVGTKASLPDNGAFGVLGLYKNGGQIFTKYTNNIAKVYKKSESSSYTYDHLAHWSIKQGEEEHNFYAFYPYESQLQNVTNSGEGSYITYTQPTAQTDMIDILTATKKSTKVDLLGLEFSHRLWAWDIIIKNSQVNNVEYGEDGTTISPKLTIVDAKIYLYGVPNNAKIPLDGGVCTITDYTTVEYEYDLFTEQDGKELGSGVSHTLNPMLFIPFNSADSNINYRLELTLQNAWGYEYVFEYPVPTYSENEDGTITTTYNYSTISNKEFTSGYRYTLIVEKKDAQGEFTFTWATKAWEEVDVEHKFE